MNKEKLLQQAIENLKELEGGDIQNIVVENRMDAYGGKMISINIQCGEEAVDEIRTVNGVERTPAEEGFYG